MPLSYEPYQTHPRVHHAQTEDTEQLEARFGDADGRRDARAVSRNANLGWTCSQLTHRLKDGVTSHETRKRWRKESCRDAYGEAYQAAYEQEREIMECERNGKIWLGPIDPNDWDD